MPFLDPNRDPAERYLLLAKAAEYVFISAQELQSESGSGKSTSARIITRLVKASDGEVVLMEEAQVIYLIRSYTR
jgi:ABC-type polar amino acid transport system ATPase subunit